MKKLIKWLAKIFDVSIEVEKIVYKDKIIIKEKLVSLDGVIEGDVTVKGDLIVKGSLKGYNVSCFNKGEQ